MAETIDKSAFHQMTYGLFLLTAREGDRDNGSIINTAIQSASEPRALTIACIKGSCTQEMIEATGQFCVSVLTEATPMAFFEHFGMQSGHDVDKFQASDSADLPGNDPARTGDGLAYHRDANAYFSCKVVSRQDLGSHVQYVGEVVEAKRLSDEPSISYGYYRNVTRKQDKPAQQGKVVAWKCVICGYIYEGAELPADFICPLCKHGVEDFEPVYEQAGGNAADAAAGEAAQAEGEQKDGSPEGEKTVAWKCTICGYVFEGAELPPDFTCPLCKRGADAFEPVYG